MERRRLDEYLEAEGLASVWFARPEGFAWVTGGDSRVDREAGVGVAAAGYDGDGVTVVAPNNETERLRDEELPEDVAVVSYPWHERDLSEAVAAVASQPAAADVDVPGFGGVDASALRQPLSDRDREAYADVGRRTAAAVEAVCKELQSTDTEGEVASALSVALSVRELTAPVVLVGGADRVGPYRHFTPTESQLGDYAAISVTAYDDGLYASCTRTVDFDAPEWLAERHAAAARVETTALAATRAVGREDGTAADVFEAVQDAYAEVGWPDEWREHHQGGAAGYAGREWIATPTSTEPVHLPQGYAWNPTVEGAKSEGTVLVDEDGFDPLTTTDDWPTIEADAVGFDVSLDRPATYDA
ncbi:M24 family metallopeptidase [Halorubellus sp. JP-L1]|uniref:M24 family metallopeptidase n=1 Tax=Halorubellus sp. JP-L1 TaxID=2715753 RepID=UPI001409AF42|nr:M24 family metallopeptidase [Halorubellus sp. JP-L1]NHN41350.1 M24 family metallopeptidase [Halorubellus sp. JP-L1]